jgi:hypothetical protein
MAARFSHSARAHGLLFITGKVVEVRRAWRKMLLSPIHDSNQFLVRNQIFDSSLVTISFGPHHFSLSVLHEVKS